MIEIVTIPIDVTKVLRSVEDPSSGAVDIFIGTTRDNSRGKKVKHLEYQAYETMAIKQMTEISGTMKERWNICKTSIVHRIGKVEIGESSVVIAVSAPHRQEAFEACRYAIDTLKKTVPIWKKEHFEEGEVWVGWEYDTPH